MLRTLLLALANRPQLGRWVTSHGVTRRLARRFVPGEDLAHAVEAARRLNQSGMTVSLDHLGENVRGRESAERAAQAYLDTLEQIVAQHLDATISLKLTHIGLDLGENFCAEQLRAVARRAAALGNFVRVDMEGSAYTERTIRMVKLVLAETRAVGAVIQAYLYRSEKDIEDLLGAGCAIRLVKGAYQEPASIAFPRKKQVEENFVRLMRILLRSGVYHGIATHDPRMIEATKWFAAQEGIGKDRFEFQMLYGIRTDLQDSLRREGYCVRIYIPFGPDWYPYFMRRLAERPANLFFFMKHLFRGK